MRICKTRPTGKEFARLGLLAAAVLTLAVAALAQQAPAGGAAATASSKQTQSKQPRAANLKLIGLAPVNPMALAKTLRPASAKLSPKASAARESSVTEFQVASGGALDATRLPVNNSKRKLLKDVHGEAYGALAPGLDGGHAAGGAVGASSKGGKTHIFIDTNHNGKSSPQ